MTRSSKDISVLQKRAAELPGLIGLAGGLPATELMPTKVIGQALGDIVRDNEALQYGWPEGLVSLRAWIAARLRLRGANVDPDRIIITSGAQQALALIGLSYRGQMMAVGAATYPVAIRAFERAGLGVVEAGASHHYVMPGVANPSGVDLIARTDLTGADVIVADEAYSELRFDGALARPLCEDAPAKVWHIGTLSKTVCPGLRVGWLVPPVGEHFDALDIKEALDLQAASITQAAAAAVLERLDYDAHLARARAGYARRADALCTALRRHLPYARFAEPQGGFAVWIELDEHGDDIELLARAIEAGTSIDPGRSFRPPGAAYPVAFRASFSSTTVDQMDEGARRLARAIERWRS